jgi:hypothetical protein
VPQDVVLKEIGMKGSVGYGRIDANPFLRTTRCKEDIQDTIEGFICDLKILKVRIAV